MTKIAVVSDVHAFHPLPRSPAFHVHDPSWARTKPGIADQSRGPFQALQTLIKEEGLEADYLLSCGDMGNAADHEGILFTWGWLQAIRAKLGANWLIGTTGNHDIDSRDVNETGDPTQSTRVLAPRFPTDDDAVSDAYWNDNVALHSLGDVDIVVLNTSAGHDDAVLAKKGLVSPQTLAKLEDIVKRTTKPKRILLAHHHPYRHDAIDMNDYSALDAGPEVLKLLQDNGSWLVVHGHRHYPNLVYAAGGVQSPVIMASGSFAARLYPELATRVRNQFHIIDLDEPGSVVGTSGPAGRVRSWEYSISAGWKQPKSDEGIPDQAGFGYRDGLPPAVSLVSEFVKNSEDRFVPLEDVFVAHPFLRYMLPIDRREMLDNLALAGVSVNPVQHYSLLPTEVYLGVTR